MRTPWLAASALGCTLLFLLACGDDGGTTSDDNGSESTTTGGPTTTTTSSTSTTETSTGTTDAESSTGTDTGGPVGPEDCIATCEVIFECTTFYETIQQCVNDCDSNKNAAADISRACEAADSDTLLCVAELDCDQYSEYLKPSEAPFPCEQELLAEVEQCTFGGTITPECADFCAVFIMCEAPPEFDEPRCLEDCGRDQSSAEEMSSECLDATNAQLSCVAGLSCQDYVLWDDGGGMDYPCMAEDDAVVAAC